jgi:hypothetical protein
VRADAPPSATIQGTTPPFTVTILIDGKPYTATLPADALVRPGQTVYYRPFNGNQGITISTNQDFSGNNWNYNFQTTGFWFIQSGGKLNLAK